MSILKICFLSLFVSVFAPIAKASDPVFVADHKYWTVYKMHDGTKYMVGYPVADEGNFTKRERPYFMITNFSGSPEASVYVGYYYKKDSEPRVVVHLSSKDPSKVAAFDFYTKDDMAWNKDPAKDITLIEAMKKGDKVVISSESTKNTNAKDTYSLEGFSAAYAAIMSK